MKYDPAAVVANTQFAERGASQEEIQAIAKRNAEKRARLAKTSPADVVANIDPGARIEPDPPKQRPLSDDERADAAKSARQTYDKAAACIAAVRQAMGGKQ